MAEIVNFFIILFFVFVFCNVRFCLIKRNGRAKVGLMPKSLKIKDLCFYGQKWGYVESVENSVAYVE